MTRGKRTGRGASQRQLRVGEELRHALAQVLSRGDIRDPDLENVTITVTEVKATPDLRQAIAYVTPLGGHNAAKVVAALNRCAGWLRGQVTHMVHLKFSPKIRFEQDLSFDAGSRIDAILREPAVMADLQDNDAERDVERDGGDEGPYGGA